MESNKYSWNQTLKFSWGHIIAFVALIFISYVMYMGDFYQNGGDFVSAAIKVAIIDIVLLTTFIGAQIVKGTDEKFDRSIIIERVLIFLCPVTFVFAMFPYNHFWSVFEQRQQIESQFNSSIQGAKQMFISYDKYAEDRIQTYENNLNSIRMSRTKKENYVHTLELQLRSQNTDSLKIVATKWIDEANQGASVWNAFLIGNVKQISDAIKSWHKTLQDYSKARLSNETIRGNVVSSFDEDGKSIEAATNGIDSLKDIYTKTTGIKLNTIWTGIIIFLMLLFPYCLQNRNTRAEGLYFLMPWRKPKSSKNTDNDITFTLSSNDTQKSHEEDVYGGTF